MNDDGFLPGMLFGGLIGAVSASLFCGYLVKDDYSKFENNYKTAIRDCGQGNVSSCNNAISSSFNVFPMRFVDKLAIKDCLYAYKAKTGKDLPYQIPK